MEKNDETGPTPRNTLAPFRTLVRVNDVDPLPELLCGSPFAALDAYRTKLNDRLPRRWMNTLHKSPHALITSIYVVAAYFFFREGAYVFTVASILILVAYYAGVRTLRKQHARLEFDADNQQRIRHLLRQSNGQLMEFGVRQAISAVMDAVARDQVRHAAYPNVAILAGAWRGQTERTLQTLARELDETSTRPDTEQTLADLRESFRKLLAIKRHLEDGSVPLPEDPRGFAASPYAAEGALVPIPRRESACGDPHCGK